MIYLDASAIVTLVAGRRLVEELNEYLASLPVSPLGTSTVGFIETVRTLDRLGDFPTAMHDLLSTLTEIVVTDELRDAAARVVGSVRTLDAIHLASAQVLGAELDSFVTYDKRMLDTALALGLPAAAPGFE